MSDQQRRPTPEDLARWNEEAAFEAEMEADWQADQEEW